MAVQFYLCKTCGNIVEKVYDAGVPVLCCGDIMEAMAPNTADAAQEKHVPAVSVEGNAVHVAIGSVAHPMLAEHFIEWICLETDRGLQRKALRVGDAPAADFLLKDEKPISVYAYCNLHGLWKAEI